MTAEPGRGVVRLSVDLGGGRRVDAKAPAPKSDVVRVALTAGSLGSAGALLLVEAASDAGDCASVWRLRGTELARVPIHDGSGKDAPDCGPPNAWSWSWASPGEGRPASLVRERNETTPSGVFHVREAFAFAGFSLDPDASLSKRELGGVEIPSWHDPVLYTNGALEMLYKRYDLSRLRPEPTLRIVADRHNGAFALRFTAPEGDLEAPVTSSETRGHRVTLQARSGAKTATVFVGLGGEDGQVPMLVEVSGFGAPYDQAYGPAGSLHGRGASVYPTIDDELASEELVSTWADAHGGEMKLELAGSFPYRIRIDKDLYVIDRARAEKPIDIVLVPEKGSGRAWGITLRGKNVIERTPVNCPAAGGQCRPDGPPERLRRLGAVANVP